MTAHVPCCYWMVSTLAANPAWMIEMLLLSRDVKVRQSMAKFMSAVTGALALAERGDYFARENSDGVLVVDDDGWCVCLFV